VDTTKAITHLSLCAGYDGIGIGLERVLPNLRAIAYVEIEAFAIANLVSKMESEQLDAAPIYSDVKTFLYKEFCGRVDILSGGFPCQPFSNAGVRKGVEDPRHLYPHISRGIEECKPRIVFLENVEGIISSKTADGESVLYYVLKDLERLGYQATAGVFSASEVGFPHQRKRVFILGYSKHNGHATSKDKREVSTGQEERRMQESPRRCDQLSDTNSVRRTEVQTERKQSRNEMFKCISKERRTVARPNEQQHEWEEPRVKPKLGRTTNGTSSRVDRLRLLGNGVVPQTATKAFITLLRRLV
jgi:DNA (cytosine-5)-methyltransferase 1